MVAASLRAARRDRDFVGVRGADAGKYLQAMLSNDVEGLAPGEACDALLLTPKARVIAPMKVLRRAADDFLLLTEQGLGSTLRSALLRSRFAAKCEIEEERHTCWIVLGGTDGVPTEDYGLPAVEVLDLDPDPTVGEEELERLRIRARTPAWGRELDERVLPAEAGLEDRAIDFEKGCYPGQEPVARLHYRGHPNRGLRVLALEGGEPPYDAELSLDGKAVGRITSSAPDPEHGRVALAYVRREVPADARLEWAGGTARQLG